MNNSKLFKLAHELTKKVIKAGDNYRVTFGAAIKAIKEGFVMTIKSIEERLIETGAKVWEKNGIKRIYCNTSNVVSGALDAQLRKDGRVFKTKTYIQDGVCHTDDGAIANAFRAINIQVVRI